MRAYVYVNRAPRHAHEDNEPIWVVYNLLKLITSKLNVRLVLPYYNIIVLIVIFR